VALNLVTPSCADVTESKDIVILPVAENMNSGKTHALFTWVASMAWVPPLYFHVDTPLPKFSYSNASSPMRALAPHGPLLARQDKASRISSSRWMMIRSSCLRNWRHACASHYTRITCSKLETNASENGYVGHADLRDINKQHWDDLLHSRLHSGVPFARTRWVNTNP